MSENIFAFRDNFVSQFAKIFESEGWVARFHKGESYWSFNQSLGEGNVSVSFSGQHVQQLTRKPEVMFAAGLSSSELDTIAHKIFPPIKGFEAQPVILAGLKIQEEIPMAESEQEPFIRGLSRKSVEWAETQDVENCIRSFAKPWETEKQTTHLAALAYVGDFNTLMDYQEMFKRGKRANFHPYVKQEVLDRAADIALERT